MEPIKTLASFVLRGLPYVSAFNFALFSSYSFLAFVVVVFLKDRNITLGKNIFWQLRSNQDWKKSRMWRTAVAMGFSPNALLQKFSLQTYSRFLWTQSCHLYAIIGMVVSASGHSYRKWCNCKRLKKIWACASLAVTVSSETTGY